MRRPPSFLVTQLVVALCSLPAGAVEREPSWLATYDGPGSFASGRGTHLVRDPSGNLYVAGSIHWGTEYPTLVLLKYDRFGDELWRAFYDGPACCSEEARGLVTDSEGSAHVVCRSPATLKYSPAGKELWARIYDGGSYPADVAVDSAGNVYVVGYGEHADEEFENEFDLVTVKYSAEGELQWIRRQDGLQAVGEGSRGRDSPAGIGLDTQENVVVTATCVPSGPAPASIVTLLYDPDGDILWATKDLGPSGEAAGVSAMAISAGGDICLTGSVGAPGEDQAFLTIRKDPSGNVLWKKVFDGDPADEPLNGAARDIALDPTGKVVVTGRGRSTGSTWEFLTVEYSLDGTRLWAERYRASPRGSGASSVGVDGAGNVYVGGGAEISATDTDWVLVTYDPTGRRTGSLRVDGGYAADSQDGFGGLLVDSGGGCFATGSIRTAKRKDEILTVKYASTLREVWRASAEGKAYRDDVAAAMTLDSAGNVIVTGSSMSADGKQDYATVKFDPSGRQAWVARFGSPQGDDAAGAVVADAEGNIVVSGMWDHMSDFAAWSQLGTVKYDRYGRELWGAVRALGTYASPDRMAFDAGGDLWIAGTVGYYEEGESDYSWNSKPFVIKYEPDGDELWVVEVGPWDGWARVVGLAFDGAGNANLAYRAVNGDYRTWLFQLDRDGNVLWLVPGIEEDFRANALACDAGGNVFVTGTTLPGGDEPGDYVTVRYGSDGVPVWAARYDGPSRGHDEAAAVAWDPAGSIVVTGTSAGEETGDDFATVKYDSDGRETWVARHARQGGLRDVARSLALDDAGNSVVAGSSMDSSGIGLQVVVAYSPAGHEMWTGALDGRSVESTWCGVAVDPDGDVYVAGTVESDLAVTKYTGPVASVLSFTMGPPPNPAVVGDEAILFVGSLPAIDRDSLLHGALFRNVAVGDASGLFGEVALYIDDGDGIFDGGKDRKAAVGGFGGDQRLELTGMAEVWPAGTVLTFFLVGTVPLETESLGARTPGPGRAGLLGGPIVAGSVAALGWLFLAARTLGRRPGRVRRLAPAVAGCSIWILACLAPSCDEDGGGGGSDGSREVQVQLDALDVDGVEADGVPALAPWKVAL